MKLATSVGLILLTSVTLGWVASCSIVAQQAEPSSSTSAQQENPSSSQESSGEYSFTFNRQPEVTYSTLPDETQYLPLFPILEAMGADYDWNQSSNTVTFFKGNNRIELEPGNKSEIATRNGYLITIPSQVSNGEVWINALNDNSSLLLGIDHVSFDESEQQWQLYDFQQQTESQTPLEKASAELIEDYLAMNPKQRTTLLSPDKEISDSSYDPEKPELPVKDIEIKSAVQLTAAGDLNQGLVKVVARYTTDYDGRPFKDFPELGYNVPGETIQEITFIVRANDGEIAIDDVINYRANRTSTGAPIPLLEEEDYIEIAQEWQRKIKPSNASYETLLQVARDFINPTLDKVVKINHNSELTKSENDTLSRFSEEVKQSQGWQNFLSLEGSKEPYYNILDATYDGKVLSATILGNWYNNSVTTTPILMEVELVKDENNSWKFTRLANVRLYQNIRELEQSEPETYSKIAKLYSYLRFVGIGLGFGI